MTRLLKLLFLLVWTVPSACAAIVEAPDGRISAYGMADLFQTRSTDGSLVLRARTIGPAMMSTAGQTAFTFGPSSLQLVSLRDVSKAADGSGCVPAARPAQDAARRVTRSLFHLRQESQACHEGGRLIYMTTLGLVWREDVEGDSLAFGYLDTETLYLNPDSAVRVHSGSSRQTGDDGS